MARLRRDWTQAQLADRARISAATVSRIESGEAWRFRLSVVQRAAAAMGIRIELSAVGRGGELDRLADEEHAAIVNRLAATLSAVGWATVAEASFSVYGERGRVDLLAFHPATRTTLVVEVKTELTDLQQLLGSLDAKRRLAPRLASDRGWRTDRVAVLLAVADTDRNRRVVHSHATLFASFERHGGRIRAWFHHPRRPAAALLLYLRPTDVERSAWLATRRRVRRRPARAMGRSSDQLAIRARYPP